MLKMSVKLLNAIQAFLLITFASQIHSWKDGTNCRKSDYYNLSTMEWDLTLNKGFPIDIVVREISLTILKYIIRNKYFCSLTWPIVFHLH